MPFADNDSKTGVFDCSDTFSKATLDIVIAAVVGVDLPGLNIDGGTNNILSFIVEESLPGGSTEGIKEEHIAGHVLQLVSAGHDTSANMLSWSTYIMATRPEIQDTLRSEIRGLLERSPYPTVAEMKSLHYLTNFIKASLRRYSPERPGADLTIDGVWVPKGTTIDLAADIPQRNPLIWGEDADEFEPTRWECMTGPQQSPYAFGVFSNGPRIGLGRGFA
ncbi:cytochrome P450 [Xylariales sp. AK1849]|nr:cytochrome P450 [Xylariales sp. AK1849]